MSRWKHFFVVVQLSLIPALTYAQGFWHCESVGDSTVAPWSIDPMKGKSGGAAIVQKVIFVAFPGTTTGGPGDAATRGGILSDVAEILADNSNGACNVEYDIVERLDAPQEAWVLSDPQESFRQCLLSDHSQYWVNGSCSIGELEARALHAVQDGYNAYYGAGNWESPLKGADAVLMIYLLAPGDESSNPLGQNVGGWGALRVYRDVPAPNDVLADVMDGAPVSSEGVLYGSEVVWWSINVRENVTKITHEWGHKLGLEHTNFVYSEPGRDLGGRHGAYSVMSSQFSGWAYPQYPMFAHPSRERLGWMAPVVVTENTRELVLRDIHDGGVALKIPIQESDVSVSIPPPFESYAWAGHLEEYFLVVWEDGTSGVYGPPDSGLYIWHVMDMPTYFTAPNPPPPYHSGDLYQRYTPMMDLEIASGLYGDPTAQSPSDPVTGIDLLDNWNTRYPWWQPGGGNEDPYLRYFGASTDLYGVDSQEFSYRVGAPHFSNPSSFGYGVTASEVLAAGYMTIGVPHDLAQDLQTSIRVAVVGVPEDGLGGVILDIMTAPAVRVTFPNGGEPITVGEPCAITWAADEVVGSNNGIIDAVDIFLVPNDDSGTRTLALDVDASLLQFTWVPTIRDAIDGARIRIVSHNVNSVTVASDESDGTFAVVADVAKFVDVSSGSGLNYAGTPYAAATLNFNGDSQGDMLITASGGPAQLYAGDQPGLDTDAPRFTLVQLSGTQLFDCRGVAVSDFDNDGDEDFFLTHASTPRLYRNEAGVSFTDVTSTLGLGTLADNSTAACWADIDRDGWLDLYVVRSGAVGVPACSTVSALQHRLFRNALGQGGGFVDVTESAGLSAIADRAALSVCAADVDGDRDVDLFVPQASMWSGGGAPHSLLLINDGIGHFTNKAAGELGDVVASCPAAEFADMDNDGDADLVVANNAGSPRVFLNDGTGTYLGEALVIDAPEGHAGLKVFDQNLDGWQDVVLLARDANHSCRLFTNRGDISFIATSALAGLQTPGPVGAVVAADFNGDGDADLFLGRPVASGEFLMRSGSRNGAPNLGRNYVKLKLESAGSGNNSAGIDARVTVTADKLVQTLSPAGGGGRGGQGDRMLVFGLGDYDGPVTAEVRWPGGWTTEVPSLTISNATVGETVNVIVDDTSPTVSNVFATSLADPNSGNLIWQFSWETDVSCDPTKDVFLIDQAGLPIPCLPSWGEINLQSGLTHVYQSKATGGYTHRYLEVSEPCTVNCRIRYSARSTAGAHSNVSAVQSRRILVCPSQN